MTEFAEIPLETRKAQAEASDPGVSAWVSANAGSGKTFVLARRVIRLLIDRVEPARILCLTFTKAAAAEMSNRIFETLGKWVVLEEDALREALADLLGRPPSEAEAARARTLFALALDTPGGLKIQTIHAFCEALLHQFPLEANVPGHFQVIDELHQAELIAEARRHALAMIDRPGGRAARLREAFAGLIDQASDTAIDKALAEIITSREQFSNWVGGDLEVAMRPLWQRFGLSPQMSEDDLLRALLAESQIDDTMLARAAEHALAAGGATNMRFAEAAQALVDAGPAHERFRLRKNLLLTKTGTARRSMVTKAVAAAIPETVEALEQDAALAEEQLIRLSTFRMLDASRNLFLFADEILDRYSALKRRRALVDFSDLIARTGNLLNRSDVREWVRYKLDRGIDHVLIDEAQDTSPEQWNIIDAIIAEFHAGEGAARTNRTVFAVGDEKQSIYSFQGADPSKFAEQAREIEIRAGNSEKPFRRVRLNLSFRSSPDILGAVDQVFSLPENCRGLGSENSGTVHQAIRRRDPGEVRIWPILAREKADEKTSWLAPIDAGRPGDPAIVLARRIADTIRGWLDGGDKLAGRDRPIRHGDILILVRRRDRFMTAVIRELKEKGLRIAGADRLKLTEHIAIEDLMALGRVMVLPEDDLSLGGVLKSPLFGVGDEELIALCRDRGGLPLYDHLARLGDAPDGKGDDEGDGGRLARRAREIHETLEKMRQAAASSTVHGFYAHVLGREGGRKAFMRRLGSEAQDVLDAFEQAALAHDREDGAGLEEFLANLGRASPEIKREVDVRRDEIRVLTVHAAKGLEAPIVFLVDPCSPAFVHSHAPSVIGLSVIGPSEGGQGGGEGGAGYVWARDRKAGGLPVQARFGEIRAAAEEEYRRLLYVAMTRAADRLIMCGYRGVREPTEDHWHVMVERALRPQAREVDAGEGNPPDLVWQHPDAALRSAMKERALAQMQAPQPASAEPVPAWLAEDAEYEPPLARPLNPSAAITLKGRAAAEDAQMRPADAGNLGDPAEERRAAMERGTAIHRLLQILPDRKAEEREALATAWLARKFGAWDEAARQQALNEALAIIADPRHQALFGPQSRAEVAIAGNVRLGGREVLVSGQIDRLAVLDDEVIIADFKTNRTVPADPGDIDEAYRLQLALYRTLLGEVYPGKPIRCLLIWTHNGMASEIGEAELRAAIESLMPA